MSLRGERRLYAAWRNPDGLIRPVGTLTHRQSGDGQCYRFAYLKAAEQFEGFHGLPGLPDLHAVHESEQLFPVFRNRLMPRRRPDYEDFVQRLNLDVETDPFEVLIRSEGWKATDRVEVFAHPERTHDDYLSMLFFLRGIRHLEGAERATLDVQVGDVLELEKEPSNPVNPRAVLVCTRTDRRIGWVPDCLVDVIHELGERAVEISVTAEHVNPESAPLHMRLLCRLLAPWPQGYEPLTGPDYQPIAG